MGLSHYATLLLATTATCVTNANAFITPSSSSSIITKQPCTTSTCAKQSTALSMALDPVTYLRTEWVSAALCTNQTPRSADKVLQLGVEDGRAVNFVPRTVREIITSSAEKKDGPENGGLTVSCERQLKQMAERRKSAAITYSNQPVDNLIDTPSSSIDVVISLQSAQRMADNGYDWKRSIREAGRVLKPGGRFLFVESAMVNGESYLDEVVELSDFSMENKKQDDEGNNGEITMDASAADNDDDEEGEEEEENKSTPIFEEVGYDQVDMVLQPHIAGVAIKAMDADLSASQKAQLKSQEESDRLAELSLNAFERGNKSRRKRKKKKTGTKGGGEGMGME